jgi:protein-tyrosine phosphatase
MSSRATAANRAGTADRRVTARSRSVRLEAAYNVRDLGGLPVRGGATTTRRLVYRADSLDQVSAADEKLLFGKLGIGTVIDLRTPEEAGGDGLADARHFPAVRAQLCPVIPSGRIGVEPFPTGDPEAIAELYLGYLTDSRHVVAQALSLVAESVDGGTPVLFHCAAGRDRTGVVAAVLLLLLGVSRAAIENDYVASNRHADEVSHRLASNPLYKRDTAAVNQTNYVVRTTMSRFLDLVAAEYPEPAKWAIGAGMTQAELDALRRVLVTPR